MFQQRHIPYLLWLVTLLGVHCANPVAPQGGPRDEQAPRLDTLKSTPNYQTRFEKQTIVLSFDEWVELKDVHKQVVVSPPLSGQPEIKIRKKAVHFEFPEEEELRPEATYTINFGEAVKDITEGNAVRDLKFIFSTGDKIDSLEVRGNLRDAFTGEAIKDALLMLYDNFSDSVVYQEQPFYFSKSDNAGNFRLTNIKNGTFKVIALKDENLNYHFDLDTEYIGFLDTLLILSDSLSPPVLNMYMFQERAPLVLQEAISPHYGLINLVFNQPPEELDIRYQPLGQEVYYEYDKDTIHMWYDLEGEKDWNIFLEKDTFFRDTLLVKTKDKTTFLKNRKLQPARKNPPDRAISLHPLKPILLKMNTPVMRLDTTKIHLYEDSTSVEVYPNIRKDSLSPATIQISFPWKEETVYFLEVMPAGMEDIFGLNNDTIQLMYMPKVLSDYGDLKLKVENLNPEKDYVLQIMGKNNKLVQERLIQGVSEFEEFFEKLSPGSYEVVIIADRNRNGKWDPGNYSQKQQAEGIYSRNLEELRANWEVEAVISPDFKK